MVSSAHPDSSAGIVNRLRIAEQRGRGSTSDRGKAFPLEHSVQSGSGFHTVSRYVGVGNCITGDKTTAT